jgi:hypothetical protein
MGTAAAVALASRSGSMTVGKLSGRRGDKGRTERDASGGLNVTNGSHLCAIAASKVMAVLRLGLLLGCEILVSWPTVP